MSINYSVLQFLELNKGKYISGGDIAACLGVSRNSVWKAVKALKNKGYEIDAVTNKGYMLSAGSKLISAQSIEKYIKSDQIRVEYADSVSSTNTVLKERAEKGEKAGLLLVASEQTAGKGRRGRSFLSKRGTGVYFSLLLRPDFEPKDSLLITTCAAVATALSIEKNADIDVKIKWVNDLFRDDKKICGILTEASFDLEGGKLDYAVLGIGINMYFPDGALPDDVKNIVGSVFDSENISSDMVSKIVADTVNYFMEEYSRLTEKQFLCEYRKKSYLDGRRVNVIGTDGGKEASVLGIDDDFRLHVKYDDESEAFLSSGEVSTKIVN